MAQPTAFLFGRYRLEPGTRRLLDGDRLLSPGGRAFDLLLALVERHPRTVSKEELLDLVWPRRVVEPNNLQVQVLALRRLLGATAIANVPGRGYRFSLPVTVEGAAAPVPAVAVQGAALIGRASELDAVAALLSQAPLVTLAGGAGIGKTRLAREALAAWPGAGAWVELAPIDDAPGVAAAAARALDLPADASALDAVVAALAATPGLLVLDNAEHVLPGVMALSEALHRHAPAARLLVTSQEPLRVAHEQVLRLAPLALPAEPGLAAAQASPAVALFVERARAADRRFALDASNADAVAEVCRRLDGIPLALELAAARLSLLGIAGLQSRLDERLHLLTRGTRGAAPRHQTLRAALEWSHRLLEPPAQRVLRRLGLFVGSFTMEAAQQLGADDALDAWGVLDQLGALVDKSLVLVDAAEPPRYRLLDSTRLLALEHLAAAGETADRQPLHARAVCAALQQARASHSTGGAALVAALAAEVDNARAALRWATDKADTELGLQVATEASFAFTGANLHAEYLQRVQPWVDRIERGGVEPAAAAALLRRVAATGKNAGHALSLRAALRGAELIRAGAGGARELHEVLVVAVAVGARRGEALPYEDLLAEARALQRPDWPRPPLANWQWARERWLMREGRYEEAVASQLAQAEALAEHAAVGAPQSVQINAAANELALGRAAQAEARAREALASLDAHGVRNSAAGYGWVVVAAVEAQRGAWAAAMASCGRARSALEREGDDLLLLPVLAACAAGLGRPQVAAQVIGHLDAHHRRTGLTPEPSEAAERARLQAVLAATLPEPALQAALEAGGRLARAEVFARALAAAP